MNLSACTYKTEPPPDTSVPARWLETDEKTLPNGERGSPSLERQAERRFRNFEGKKFFAPVKLANKFPGPGSRGSVSRCSGKIRLRQLLGSSLSDPPISPSSSSPTPRPPELHRLVVKFHARGGNDCTCDRFKLFFSKKGTLFWRRDICIYWFQFLLSIDSFFFKWCDIISSH